MKSRQSRLEAKKKRRSVRKYETPLPTPPSRKAVEITEFGGGLLRVIKPFVIQVTTSANGYRHWKWAGVCDGGCPAGPTIGSAVYRSIVNLLKQGVIVDNTTIQEHIENCLTSSRKSEQ